MDYKIQTINRFSEIDKNLYEEVRALTQPIEQIYPKYNRWLNEKFFPNIQNGSRKMVLATDKSGKLAGVALLKDTEEEKKICCLFIREDSQRRGLGKKLMHKSLEILNTDKPLMTVSDKVYPQFNRLLDFHQFKLSYKKQDAYKEGDAEYYFNNKATDILKEKILNPLFAGAFRKHR